MTNLNDKIIRSFLIERLGRQSVRPRKIIEELRVHNGNAIADVVALYNDAHCYEIKSDLDKIDRIGIQAQFYDLSFRRITLVTTARHVDKAIEKAPPFWGLMMAFTKNDRVIIRNIRRAKNNPQFSKLVALKTLWKSELIKLAGEKVEPKNPSREKLATYISKIKGKKQISNEITTSLVHRSQNYINQE